MFQKYIITRHQTLGQCQTELNCLPVCPSRDTWVLHHAVSSVIYLIVWMIVWYLLMTFTHV